VGAKVANCLPKLWGGGAFADGFLCEESLLADAVGDFGEFALIGADGGEVVNLADEKEGAESFPDLFVAGINGGDLVADGYACARDYGEGADASGDGGAEFGGLLTVLRGVRWAIGLQFGNEPALMDGGTDFIGIGDPAGAGGHDSGGL